MTDRHRDFKSQDVGGQIHLNLVTAYDLKKNKLTQRGFVGEEIVYRGVPLLTSNTSLKACGGPEAVACTAVFKNCGVKTSSGRQEHIILKPNFEFPYTVKYF